jgi:pimeloyl-ACP methyl ester carboxylesterase
MTLFLSFRNSRAGILIKQSPFIYRASDNFELKMVALPTLKSEAAGRDILFAIHGYNNSEAEAICALTRLSQTLDLPSDALFIGILWPGDSLAGFVSYPFEKPTARYSGQYLGEFCKRELPKAASISFVSHSLGARVALEAIRHLDRDTRSACLMAAAIERDCLEKEYADSFAKTGVTYVLASRKDWVLQRAFPLGNIIGHLLDPTSHPMSKALGFEGPERAIGKTRTPWQIKDGDDYLHGSYLPSSDSDHGFPPEKPPRVTKEYRDAIKYVEATNFIRRAFNLERQTWPAPG